MFENFTIIPENDHDLVQMYTVLNDIKDQMGKVIDQSKWYQNWYTNYALSYLAKVMTLLNSLSENESGSSVAQYYDAGQYSIRSTVFDDSNNNDYGLVINQEAGTHFNMDDFIGVTYLTQAEEFLKQTPQHFLKIFTMKDDKKIYVWTNKPLLPITYFRLLELQKTLFPRENPWADEAIKAFLDGNAAAFKNVFVKYLTSDAVTEVEFKNFSLCITSQKTREIQKLESNIQSERGNIAYYEQELVQGASRIREWNEQIDFLKSRQDEDEDTRTLFKLLKRSPYIKSFDPKPSSSKILLQYEAPILYFSDYPAEKYLEKSYVSDSWKQVIKIFLGRKYELMTCCALHFKTANFGIEFADRSLNIETTALPHPHIMRFHCFGNHGTAIREAAETGNYLGAIEQITQAVMNLNFYDSCVINEMLKEIVDNSYRTIWREKSTGMWYSTAQILERNDYYEET